MTDFSKIDKKLSKILNDSRSTNADYVDEPHNQSYREIQDQEWEQYYKSSRHPSSSDQQHKKEIQDQEWERNYRSNRHPSSNAQQHNVNWEEETFPSGRTGYHNKMLRDILRANRSKKHPTSKIAHKLHCSNAKHHPHQNHTKEYQERTLYQSYQENKLENDDRQQQENHSEHPNYKNHKTEHQSHHQHKVDQNNDHKNHHNIDPTMFNVTDDDNEHAPTQIPTIMALKQLSNLLSQDPQRTVYDTIKQKQTEESTSKPLTNREVPQKKDTSTITYSTRKDRHRHVNHDFTERKNKPNKKSLYNISTEHIKGKFGNILDHSYNNTHNVIGPINELNIYDFIKQEPHGKGHKVKYMSNKYNLPFVVISTGKSSTVSSLANGILRPSSIQKLLLSAHTTAQCPRLRHDAKKRSKLIPIFNPENIIKFADTEIKVDKIQICSTCQNLTSNIDDEVNINIASYLKSNTNTK
ncbi:hypothetical protein N9A04_00140 [Rickettsiales bacterium]|nr:hypothetical protein [Rickettsiales bacterium]